MKTLRYTSKVLIEVHFELVYRNTGLCGVVGWGCATKTSRRVSGLKMAHVVCPKLCSMLVGGYKGKILCGATIDLAPMQHSV